MINKLQGALEEFARGDVESAVEAEIDNLKGDNGDAMEIMSNVLPPAETDAEISEDEVLEKVQVETPPQEDDNDDVSSEAIRYNSKGESIENPKAHASDAKACHDDKEVKEVLKKPVVEEKSSSIEEHVQRFDSDGNSIEKLHDPSTESEQTVEVVKRKNKKVTTSNEILLKKKEDINRALNKQVVDDQLGMRQMESDESGFNEDDDIPVITIPMGNF